MYRAETAQKKWPKRVIRLRFIQAPEAVRCERVDVIMRYGMRKERKAVRRGTAEDEMRTELIAHFLERQQREWASESKTTSAPLKPASELNQGESTQGPGDRQPTSDPR
jgi:hypothetical protein